MRGILLRRSGEKPAALASDISLITSLYELRDVL